jgi:hypothetical protein
MGALIAAASATANLRLFLEPRHGLGVVPAWASKIVVVFVAVFFQATPHMALGLMTAEGSCSHVTISMVAGATRADMIIDGTSKSDYPL